LRGAIVFAASARAFTIGADANSITLTSADIGSSFNVNWSRTVGHEHEDEHEEGSSLLHLAAHSVWTVLGLTSTQLTLSATLTNTTLGLLQTAITSFGIAVGPNATGAFAPGCAGNIFDTVSHGSGPHQNFPGGFVGIDACFFSGSQCSGGSFWSGLLNNASDTLTMVLSGAFGDGSVNLALFPLKFQTGVGSFESAGVVSAVPLPASLWLFAAALAGLSFMFWSRRARSDAYSAAGGCPQ
jgi:hypothetical protein